MKKNKEHFLLINFIKLKFQQLKKLFASNFRNVSKTPHPSK